MIWSIDPTPAREIWRTPDEKTAAIGSVAASTAGASGPLGAQEQSAGGVP